MASAALDLPILLDVDPVLAAAERAPLVEETDEERALMAEIEGRPVRWIKNDPFMSKVRDSQR